METTIIKLSSNNWADYKVIVYEKDVIFTESYVRGNRKDAELEIKNIIKQLNK